MKNPFFYIEKFLSGFYSKINSNTLIKNETLSFYRVFFSMTFLFLFRPSYSWICEVPQGFFLPKVLNITSFFDGFPSCSYLLVTEYLIIILLILSILGIYARIALLGLFFITLINSGFAYSLGKIDHYILVSMSFLVLSLSNSSTHYAIKPDKEIKFHNLTLSIFGLIIVFGFFTAGLQKAYHWLDFDLRTSGTLRWIYDIYLPATKKPILADLILKSPSIVHEIMDYTAVIFEISGLFFLLFSRKSWKLYLIIASFFHLSNTLILNIPFTFHFPIFGIWILSNVLFKQKFLTVPYGISFFLKGIFFPIFLWGISIILAVYSLFTDD